MGIGLLEYTRAGDYAQVTSPHAVTDTSQHNADGDLEGKNQCERATLLDSGCIVQPEFDV